MTERDENIAVVARQIAENLRGARAPAEREAVIKRGLRRLLKLERLRGIEESPS